MKNYFLLAALVLGLVGVVESAGSRDDAWSFLEVQATSGGLVAVGPARLKAIYASSDTANFATYMVAIDTNSGIVFGETGLADTARYRSPVVNFPTLVSNGSTISVVTPGMYKVVDYGDDGVRFDNGIYIHKSAATSGQARRAYILYRK